MRFEPVHFGKSYRTIPKPDIGNSFQLSPATSSVSFAQDTADSNTGTGGYSLDLSNPSDNLKVHRGSSSRNSARDQKCGASSDAANQRGLQSAAEWPCAGEASLHKTESEQSNKCQHDRKQ